MATEFSEVLNRAISKFSDYNFLSMEDIKREEVLTELLINAIYNFTPICDTELSDYNLENKSFTSNLTRQEINILASAVALEWVKQKTLNTEVTTNKLSTKDATFHSSSQLLSSLTMLMERLQNELDKQIILYTYTNKREQE